MTKGVEAVKSKVLSQNIVEAMLDIKATDIAVIDLRKIRDAVADYFIICSGSSDTHIQSITETVAHKVKEKLDERPWNSEGKDSKHWKLLDYGDIVVHVFMQEKREFYAIEKLWADAKIQTIASQ